MECQCDGDGGVERGIGGAVVGQLLAVQMWERLAFAVDAWHQHIETQLHRTVTPVDGPSLAGRVCSGLHEVDQMVEQVGPALSTARQREFSIVEDGSRPHVVHQGGETNHHGEHAEGTSELSFRVCINGRIVEPPDLLCLLPLPVFGRLGVGLDVGGTVRVSIRMAVRMAVRVPVRMPIGISIRIAIAARLAIDGASFGVLLPIRQRRRRRIRVLIVRKGCGLARSPLAARSLDKSRIRRFSVGRVLKSAKQPSRCC